MKYFINYLKIAPMSLAVWRSPEADVLSKYDYPEPLLDLGCGFGEFATAFFDNPVGWGLDINPHHLRLAGRSKKYQHLTLSDARQMPFANATFQTVLAMSVLEHISGVEKVFTEVYRVLKPGGYFILSVPTNELNQELIGFRVLKQLGLKQLANRYVKLYHRVFKHEVIISKQSWIDIAKQGGFEIIEQQPALSKRQLQIFELTLPLSIPGRITQHLFNIRNPFPWRWREKMYSRLLNRWVQDQNLTNLNMVLVLKKPT